MTSIGCVFIDIENSDYKKKAFSRLITYNGETKRKVEWARILGLQQATFAWRIKTWGIERTMSEYNSNQKLK